MSAITEERQALPEFLTGFMAIHDAMRRDADRLVALSEQLRSPASAALGSALVAWWSRVEGAIVHHHEAEDGIVWPDLVVRRPEFADRRAELEVDHHALDEAMLAVRRALIAMAGGHDEVVSRHEALTGFARLLDDHLRREEAAAFPLLAVAVTPEEYAALERRLGDGSSLGRIAFELPWVLDERDPPAGRSGRLTPPCTGAAPQSPRVHPPLPSDRRSRPGPRPMTAPTAAQLDLRTVVDRASRFLTTEYASLTRAGDPVTWPVTPYRGQHGQTLDIATGLTYPLKAERARRDARVALSFSFPVGSGLDPAPTYLVQGLATVRDADLVATSSRYLRASAERFPESFAQIPTFMLRRMDWYWTRMWVEVTPTLIHCWPDGDLGAEPDVWRAPDGTSAPASDPAPRGRGPGSWSRRAPTWQERRRGVLERLGQPVITTVDEEGWPLPWRARGTVETASGYVVVPPAGLDVREGRAFVSFHEHAEVFDGQENAGFSAEVTVRDGEVHVDLQRALSDFGVPRSQLRSAIAMLRAGRSLRPRLATEAARRDTRVPSFAELRYVRPRATAARGA